MTQNPAKTSCPYCGLQMRPAVMRCDHCEIEIAGRFQQTHFAALSAEDLQFLQSYLLAEFSIKALAEESGMGYAAIRTRLDRIIDTYRSHWRKDEQKRRILERLENGEISANQAAKALEKLK